MRTGKLGKFNLRSCQEKWIRVGKFFLQCNLLILNGSKKLFKWIKMSRVIPAKKNIKKVFLHYVICFRLFCLFSVLMKLNETFLLKILLWYKRKFLHNASNTNNPRQKDLHNIKNINFFELFCNSSKIPHAKPKMNKKALN